MKTDRYRVTISAIIRAFALNTVPHEFKEKKIDAVSVNTITIISLVDTFR